MKIGRRFARLSAAVVAAISISSIAHAQTRNLTWDPAISGAPSDASGTWDTSTSNWYDPTANADTTWSNANPDSATFGSAVTSSNSSASFFNVSLGADITAQNITFGTDAAGNFYNLLDQGDGLESLTLAGNIVKTSNVGTSVIQLYNPITLTSGNHTVTINDTPGDTPELSVNSSSGGFALTGSGSLTLDNGANSSGYAQWGTFVLNSDSDYSGGTNVVKGRLIANTSNALGTGPVVISSQGNLAFGGAGTTPASSLTISNSVTITRSVYTGTDYSDYPDAITSSNSGNANNTVTFTGPLIVDSSDARIAADTSIINFNTPFVVGPDVAAGTAVADIDGDFSGTANLNADNTAYAAAGGAIGITGGVEVNASNIGELGGTGSSLVLNGGILHITSALVSSDPNIVNNFGAGTSHNINTSAVSTGVDLDSGITFTVNNLSGGGVGERGTGTLDFTGTNNFSSGNPFFDGGIINYEAGSSTSQGSIGVRSATVNIDGALTLGGNTTSIGDSATGTNGGPDMATINISTTGSLIETGGGDFDISNGANTKGTINMYGNAVLTTAGITWLGKSNGAVGTINQYGGALTVNRNGNFGFVIADGRNSQTPTGVYNLSAGTFSDPAGEIYVGEGNGSGTTWGGTWNQTGGTATFGNWFVVGREGGIGTVNISGGSLTKTGTVGADTGSNISVGEGSSNVNTVTVSGTGTFTENNGEMWIGNSSGIGVLNIGTAAGALTNADSAASVTVNNWFAVGRSGASTGTVNLYDGTLTQATNNWFDISGDGGSSTGIVNVYGGTLNALQMYLGENGSGTATLNINGGSVNITNNSIFANGNSVTGTINLNGGTLTAFGFQAQNGGGTGKATFDFNGGTLKASTNNTSAFIGAKVTSIVSAGGAFINTNGFAVTINSALTHDTTLSGADGGLTVSGTGNLTLGGVNTYNGATNINQGTVTLSLGGSIANSAITVGNGTTAGTLAIAANTSATAGFLAKKLTSLAVSSTGTVNLSNAAASAGPNVNTNRTVLVTSALSVATGGVLNLGSNDMILHNGTLGTVNTAGSIANLIAGGRGANGLWTSSGINSSSVAAAPGKLAIGVELNNTGSGTYFSTFDGQSVTTTDVLVKYTYAGDADLSGKVDATDYGLIDNGFNNQLSGWRNGDFNYDGVVNGDDYTLIDNAYNTQGSVSLAGVSAGPAEMIADNTDQIAASSPVVSAVPEPTTLSLLAIGAAGLMIRRRRRRAATIV